MGKNKASSKDGVMDIIFKKEEWMKLKINEECFESFAKDNKELSKQS